MSQKNVLIKESIQTKKSFTDNKEATVAAGNILFENGYVEQEYINSMLEKLETQSFATYIGFRKHGGAIDVGQPCVLSIDIDHRQTTGHHFVGNKGIVRSR